MSGNLQQLLWGNEKHSVISHDFFAFISHSELEMEEINTSHGFPLSLKLWSNITLLRKSKKLLFVLITKKTFELWHLQGEMCSNDARKQPALSVLFPALQPTSRLDLATKAIPAYLPLSAAKVKCFQDNVLKSKNVLVFPVNKHPCAQPSVVWKCFFWNVGNVFLL